MKIAVASGKGGTGKTTIATALAYVAAKKGKSVAYVDCDVEEPNGHILLHPRMRERRLVSRPVVWIDVARCNGCRRCQEVCQFSAIVWIGPKVLIYPQLCHGCGACSLACRQGAIGEQAEEVGIIEMGEGCGIEFAHGVMHVGHAKCIALIRAVRQVDLKSDVTILDAPPGASCPVVATLRGVDLVLLVAEPTPFGLHDLGVVLEVVRSFRLPCAVVINRVDLGDGQLRRFCEREGIPVLADLPEDPAIARVNAQGRIVPDCLPQYQPIFEEILGELLSLVPPGAISSAGPARTGGAAS